MGRLIAAVVGGAGAIGSAVVADLEEVGEVVSMDLAGADVAIDVRDEADVERAFDEIPRLDALIYVSGVQLAAQILATDVDDWDELFAVNARGAFLSVRAALARFDPEVIVLVASIAGLRSGGPGLTAYSASKGAEISFGRALAVELAPTVRVNVVCPGWTDTPFNVPAIDYMGGVQAQSDLIRATVPLRRQGMPEDIALGVRFAATNPYMTGALIVIDGGVTLH